MVLPSPDSVLYTFHAFFGDLVYNYLNAHRLKQLDPALLPDGSFIAAHTAGDVSATQRQKRLRVFEKAFTCLRKEEARPDRRQDLYTKQAKMAGSVYKYVSQAFLCLQGAAISD